MSEDISAAIARLLQSGEIESATLTVTLKPKPAVPPPPDDAPVCVITIGPVSTKLTER